MTNKSLLEPRKCEVCGKETCDPMDRWTAIDWVCPECYPTYKVIHDKLKKYWNGILRKKLDGVRI